MERDLYICCPSHCCFDHGCKYRHEECPVKTGKVQQEYPCVSCEYVWKALAGELKALRVVKQLWELGSFAGSLAEFDPGIRFAQAALARLDALEARRERTHGLWERNQGASRG